LVRAVLFECLEASIMFTWDHAFEWMSAVLVVASTLISSAIRSRLTLRERQWTAIRRYSELDDEDDSPDTREDSFYL
jgi:hypothetical protein